MKLKLQHKSNGWIEDEALGVEAEKYLVYTTDLGSLYEGDCNEILSYIHSESVDTVFADPPSINKEYSGGV